MADRPLEPLERWAELSLTLYTPLLIHPVPLSAPQPTPSSSAPPPTNTSRDRLHHRQTPYGNYKHYYSFRPASSAPSLASTSPPPPSPLDGRLALLDPALFAQKSILDLGTNAGKISHELAAQLHANDVLGVDIDPVLVQDAQRIAREQALDGRRGTCEFVCDDFMQPGWFAALEQARGRHRFEVVLLFSVTKWLHLHHGDAGMRALFHSLHALLPPRGVVVVEPQEWENYQRAVKKNKDLREVFKTLEMRPPFEDEMTGAGFELEKRIERDEGGFSRPLMIWRKSAQ
ncbi:hypothetical protein JCM5296_007131 [Sporobolomyces johnsonii]